MTSTATTTAWTDLIEVTLKLQKPTILYGVSWDDYKELQCALGENRTSLRVSFSRGILGIMPESTEHAFYTRLIEQFLTAIKLRTRRKIEFFGSATMEKSEKRKGAEADASFFVSRVNLIKGIRFNLAETPPDVVVEIDVHHASQEKFEIYSAFGVAEFWLYDEKELKIYRLNANGEYESVERSLELPILSAAVLTEFLNRSQTSDQTDVLFEFDNWLAEQTEN